MQKIPSLFVRDDFTRQVVDEVVEGREWVLAGEGVATVKYDGTSCLVRNGLLFKRHQHKAEKGVAPKGWLHWDFDPEVESGHGWLPVDEGPSDRWHREALAAYVGEVGEVRDGTYELVGPKVQKNPHDIDSHELWIHGGRVLHNTGRDFGKIRDFIASRPIEGIVWHHPDGRMAKIKARDFGIAWPRRDS